LAFLEYFEEFLIHILILSYRGFPALARQKTKKDCPTKKFKLRWKKENK